ncbi:2Fe-2S iron-sulfur cluster-binding protein [Vibrio spartinae]|uniref:CDP-6-deoxy-L-threo-D-glycero-4-hexulose-3-dehydrase reductase n=1 Tax=Vibrio spartinae TaxID=1918945 RepID=A0A1N6M531_9VIBR|nr:2Fe-2S iron-sulfur cluster-binding protein [Vibrio spartinae]SIO94457.1 CDP-6-deoxy-L-threo-D-glycero-4-hexulose-3-dehydrase reductase [Vibrio spartinae]
MTFTVRLLPEDLEFTIERGQTVLDAAIRQQIPFPYRCRVGACGMCLCKKLSGEVSYQLEPMLTEEEQSQGWIFSCQAYAQTHLVLTWDE